MPELQLTKRQNKILINNPETMLKLYLAATHLFKKNEKYSLIQKSLDQDLRNSIQHFAKQMLLSLTGAKDAKTIMINYKNYIFSMNALANSYHFSNNSQLHDNYPAVKNYVLDLIAIGCVISEQNKLMNPIAITPSMDAQTNEIIKKMRIYAKLANE